MDSVTRLRDVLALNWWVNLRSKLAWVASIAISAAIAADVIARRLEVAGESLAKTVALFFVLFMALMTAIWLVGLIFLLLVVSANLMRKGAIGPKRFTISDHAFTEDDGHRITAVSWGHIRSIDKTRRHIFVRISRWKYMLLSARDFQNEYEFAQYYADLVKAKHENT
jgi:hypothetical protein